MHKDWTMKLSRPISRIRRMPENYLDGHVLTPHGIVSCYSQGSATDTPHTSLTVVINGRMYTRGFNRRYSTRGMVTLAARFAAELSRGKP